ncbi:MAG: hypothetical protein ABI895_27810 [Deltaproteobacteria bacterium]
MTSTDSRRSGPGESTELSPGRMWLHFAVALAAVFALGGLLGGGHVALSAAIGVVLCAVNLLVMRRITRALTEGGSAVWALALPLKLLVLVAAAFLLVHTRAALAFPLAIGFAVLPLTSVFLPRPSSVRGRA